MHKHVWQTVIIAFAALTATTASAQDLVYDADAGGWVDKQAGLVWGYDYATITGYPGGESTAPSVDYGTAKSLAANYADLLLNFGWVNEAVVAAHWEDQGLGWRLPTIQEAQA